MKGLERGHSIIGLEVFDEMGLIEKPCIIVHLVIL